MIVTFPPGPPNAFAVIELPCEDHELRIDEDIAAAAGAAFHRGA